jgi:hypothetical protein
VTEASTERSAKKVVPVSPSKGVNDPWIVVAIKDPDNSHQELL